MPAVTDTSPEIAAMVRSRLMARTAEERFVMGVRMFDAAREMILASLPSSLSPREHREMLFHRIYGHQLPRHGLKARDFADAGAGIHSKA